MVSILKDITPLLLGGAVIYVVVNSGILKGVSGAVEGTGEGIAEAAQGLGGGIAFASRGLGAGIGQVGLTSQDILGIFSAGAEFATGVIQQRTLRGEREFSQETEIDVITHEKVKEPISEIQAGEEIIVAEEKAKRKIIIAEEKTQWTERLSEIDDAALIAFQKAGSGLLKYWQYSPFGLLKTFIEGQGSVEETQTAQTQETTQPISGAAIRSSISAPTSTGSGGVSRSIYDPIPAMEALGAYGQSTPLGVVYTFPNLQTNEPEPSTTEKAVSYLKKATSWISPWW